MKIELIRVQQKKWGRPLWNGPEIKESDVMEKAPSGAGVICLRFF